MTSALRFPLVALLTLLVACHKLAPGGPAGASGREYAASMEATIAAVRDAARQTGLVVASERLITQDEWALDGKAGPSTQASVRATVIRAGARSRVVIEQQDTRPAAPTMDTASYKRITVRRKDYRSEIYKILDERLRSER